MEPEQEKNMNLIPSEIWDANIIGGDMNGLPTTFEKAERVYHFIGIGTLIKTIKVPTIISDHPLLIFEQETMLRLKENNKQIIYLDK